MRADLVRRDALPPRHRGCRRRDDTQSALRLPDLDARLACVISRYSRPAMARIWSDEARLARWLEVELAALEGWAEIGIVPKAAVDSVVARAAPPTPERVAEIERRTQHDVAAFVDAVAEELGEEG